MRIIVIECRDEESTDYWWKYTLELLYKGDQLSFYQEFSKHPYKHILFNRFDLYFISRYSMDKFMKSRHDVVGGMQDYQYEEMLNDFERRLESSDISTKERNVF